VPCVIPKVLEQAGMVAVISSIAMVNGYTAFPIAYFSKEEPTTRALANPWNRTSRDFVAPDGGPAWTILTASWDFELRPWIENGRAGWIESGDPALTVQRGPTERCPFVNLPGLRLRQTIKQERRYTKPPPHNEHMDPFSG
jgi:hypothetical protein